MSVIVNHFGAGNGLGNDNLGKAESAFDGQSRFFFFGNCFQLGAENRRSLSSR